MNENQKQNIVFIKDLGRLHTSKTKKYKASYGQYQCFCGKKFRAQYREVKIGHYQSCGCLRGIRHGLSNHRLYKIWNSMIHRCHNPKSKAYSYYGERGISVCDEWLDINNFIDDMYPTFKKGLSLDRINNNLGYFKDNCRWTNKTIQTRNTRKLYSHNTSGYRGVSWDKKNNKYRASIKANGKYIHIGYGSSALECAKLYDQYVINSNLEHTRNFS